MIFRRRKRSMDKVKECLGNKQALLHNYMQENGPSNECEALRDLVDKGYSYWLLEQKYEKVKLDDPTILDMSVRYGKVLHAYFRNKLLLRDLIQDFRGLLLTFSSLLNEAKLICRSTDKCDFDPEEYEEALKNYYEKYIKPVQAVVNNVTEGDEIEDLIRDLEILLTHFKDLNRARKENTAGKK